jgi:phosphatidylglycerophosphatase A
VTSFPITDSVVRLLATGGYIGYAKVAPGTVGSLAALPFCYLLSLLNNVAGAVLLVLTVGGAAWIAGKAEIFFNKEDPGCIVIDEIAGMLVTLFALSFTFWTVTLGFLFFRFFDIIKPFPIRLIDARIKGGWGIVADDIAAGILANISIRLIACTGFI